MTGGAQALRPQTGEPGAFAAGHGEYQAVLAGVLVPRTADN